MKPTRLPTFCPSVYLAPTVEAAARDHDRIIRFKSERIRDLATGRDTASCTRSDHAGPLKNVALTSSRLQSCFDFGALRGAADVSFCTEPAGGRPADVSEADKHKYPYHD